MKTSHMTDQQRRAFIDAAEAIAEIIKYHTEHPALGICGVPSGHLYAKLMGHMSFDTYRAFISYLIATHTIKQSNYLLTYIRADQPYPETDDAISIAKRVVARIAAGNEVEDDEERDFRLGHP